MNAADIKAFRINGEDGSSISGVRTNMGEPYRDGVSIWISDGRDEYSGSGVFVQKRDLDELISHLQAIRTIL